MTKRVAIGHLGTDGTAKYGLRVARSGYEAAPTSSSSAPVAVDNLVFDSLNPIGFLPIYKIYDVTVSAGSYVSGSNNTQINPGSYTQSFGTTLSYIPMPFGYRKESSNTILRSDYWLVQFGDYLAFNNDNIGIDRGWEVDVTTTNFTVKNYSTSSQTIRVFLLNTSSV